MSRLMMICAVAICCMAAAQPPRKRSTIPASPDLPDKVFGRGVPLSLALDRAQRVSDLRYNLHFDVPAEVTARITGTATITFTLKDATRPLVLDFAEPGRLEGRIGGRTVTLTAADDHVVILPADLREGANEITLQFAAGDASLNRNPDFMYTLFVPARARLAFPCFD